MYHNGTYVSQDYTKAVQYYELAADGGNAEAQNNLGHMYHHGLGVKKDHIKAVYKILTLK